MHRPSPMRFLFACLALACASAMEPTPPRDLLDFEIDPPRIASRIRVMGNVTDPNADPVPGATVFVRAFTRRNCRGGRAAEGRVLTRQLSL
jgi:hypothetical protein